MVAAEAAFAGAIIGPLGGHASIVVGKEHPVAIGVGGAIIGLDRARADEPLARRRRVPVDQGIGVVGVERGLLDVGQQVNAPDAIVIGRIGAGADAAGGEGPGAVVIV